VNFIKLEAVTQLTASVVKSFSGSYISGSSYSR